MTMPWRCAITQALAAALPLAMTQLLAAVIFDYIAAAENINDARAGQVTAALGGCLACAWLAGFVYVLVKRNVVSGIRYLAGVGGVAVGVAASGSALMAAAKLPAIVVTPPAAWLIMTLAGVLLGTWSAKQVQA